MPGGAAVVLAGARRNGYTSAMRLSRTPEYASWRDMIRSCVNPKFRGYARCGAAGVKVCARWRDSFAAFLADMGLRPEGCVLARKSDGGDYTPANCSWRTWKQLRNDNRSNHVLEFRGERHNMTEWSEIAGIPRATIEARLRRLGGSVEKALTCPVKKRRDNAPARSVIPPAENPSPT